MHSTAAQQRAALLVAATRNGHRCVERDGAIFLTSNGEEREINAAALRKLAYPRAARERGNQQRDRALATAEEKDTDAEQISRILRAAGIRGARVTASGGFDMLLEFRYVVDASGRRGRVYRDYRDGDWTWATWVDWE